MLCRQLPAASEDKDSIARCLEHSQHYPWHAVNLNRSRDIEPATAARVVVVTIAGGWQVCEVDGFANQRSLETGESLNRISIVIVPDPFFPAPTQKEKSGLAMRD